MPKLRFTTLNSMGDQRGASFSVTGEMLSFLERVADIHVAAIVPGAIRGNHFHIRRREVLVVLHHSEWALHWDEGQNTSVQMKEFSGCGAEVLLIEPGASHAVHNTGSQVMTVFGLSPEPYDPTETIRRSIV